MENNCDQRAHVIAGKLTNVKLKNTTAEIFFSTGDSDGMAATGVVAAALGSVEQQLGWPPCRWTR